MKIVNYSVEEGTNYGFPVDRTEFVPRYFIEEVLREKIPRDIKRLLPDMELIELIRASLENVKLERVLLLSVHLEPPIKDPRKIISIALNYRDHTEEVGSKILEEIVFFLKPPTTLIGPFDSIIKPGIAEKIDYEGELAVIIGERAKEVDSSEALFYVFG